MAKYKDTKNAGRSEKVPFRPGESGDRRHERRKRVASSDRFFFGQWCEEHGIAFRVGNHGHHWQMFFGGKMIEWWPSSAKCVVEQTWNQGVHVHDTEQLKTLIKKEWEL